MPAGTEILPHEARVALDEYLAALDAALPGIVLGIYVTGSGALGDWRPRRSDLDILTVTERRLDDGGLAALEALHAGLPGRPYRDAVYLPAEAIGARPAPGADGGTVADTVGKYPSAVDVVFHRARYFPYPVLWATLEVTGPPPEPFTRSVATTAVRAEDSDDPRTCGGQAAARARGLRCHECPVP